MGVASHLGIKLTEYDSRIRTFIPHYEEMLDVAAAAIPPRARTIVDLGIGTGALSSRCLADGDPRDGRSASTSTRRSWRWPSAGSARRADLHRRILSSRAAARLRRGGRVLRAASRPHAGRQGVAVPAGPRRAAARRRLPQRRLAARPSDAAVRRAQFDEWLAPSAPPLQRRARPGRSLRPGRTRTCTCRSTPRSRCCDRPASASSCCGAGARSPSSGRRVRFRLKSLDDARARELVQPGRRRLPSALGGAVAARSARAVPQADRAIVHRDRASACSSPSPRSIASSPSSSRRCARRCRRAPA